MLHGVWGLNQPFDSEGAAGWTATVAQRRVSTAGVTPGVESAERNRLMQPPRSFAEFWPHYVLAHRHPATRAFHFTGTLAAWGAARRGNPVAQPVAGGGGAAAAVRPRLVFALLRRAQPPGDVRPSALVLADRPENGRTDAGREDGRRSPPRHKCISRWQGVQRVIRFCSASSPNRLRRWM